MMRYATTAGEAVVDNRSLMVLHVTVSFISGEKAKEFALIWSL